LAIFPRDAMMRCDEAGRRTYAALRMDRAVKWFLTALAQSEQTEQIRSAMWVRAWAIPAGYRAVERKRRRT
jgi:hypothetical protein